MFLLDLSKPWQIVVLILLILLATYILVFIVNLIFVFSFGKMMRRENRAIRVALSTKLDILKKCGELITANEIKLTERCLHSLKYLDNEDFLEVQKDEYFQSTAELEKAEKEIVRILTSNRKLSGKDEVELLKSLIKDVNESLRILIMGYNADVLGYNYWVRFPPCKYVFLLFKVKTKKTI